MVKNAHMRILAQRNARIIASNAKAMTESTRTFTQHTGRRNGYLDLAGRQIGRMVLKPCGAQMGVYGTCTTVL